MTIFIFDVDNTLTPPRQKILHNNSKIFTSFITAHKTYLVSGSDYEKLQWQLPANILDQCAGVFTCLGNCYHVKNQLKFKNSFEQLSNQDLRSDINNFINNSKTPIKTYNHIEERIGMINISSIGRAASIEQRKIYHDFDNIEQERKKFVNFLINKYDYLDVSVGGEISIDISVKGFNKSQILNHLPNKNNLVFFGDRCHNGGNDEPLAAEIIKLSGTVYNVKDYIETFKILSKLTSLEQGE